jgi:hypothetical protein
MKDHFLSPAEQGNWNWTFKERDGKKAYGTGYRILCVEI